MSFRWNFIPFLFLFQGLTSLAITFPASGSFYPGHFLPSTGKNLTTAVFGAIFVASFNQKLFTDKDCLTLLETYLLLEKLWEIYLCVELHCKAGGVGIMDLSVISV